MKTTKTRPDENEDAIYTECFSPKKEKLIKSAKSSPKRDIVVELYDEVDDIQNCLKVFDDTIDSMNVDP